MQALHCGIISIPGSQKIWTWKLSPILPPQITENRKTVPKVGPKRLPKSNLKSIKMYIWALRSIKMYIWASVCPLGAPLHPRITKMVSQVPKKEPQGLQNNSFR